MTMFKKKLRTALGNILIYILLFAFELRVQPERHNLRSKYDEICYIVTSFKHYNNACRTVRLKIP